MTLLCMSYISDRWEQRRTGVSDQRGKRKTSEIHEAGGSRRSAQQTDACVWPSLSWCVPPVETQVVSIVPPGNPCLSPSPFLLIFPFLFALLRFPLPFSFCCFSFVSCVAFFAFLFRCLALLGGGFFSFVSVLHPPPALLASLHICIFPLCAVFLAYFFRFRFGRRLFHPVFLMWVLCCLLGFDFCCGSLAYDMYLIRTYADLTYLCFAWGIWFVLVTVYYLLFLFVFLLR